MAVMADIVPDFVHDATLVLDLVENAMVVVDGNLTGMYACARDLSLE